MNSLFQLLIKIGLKRVLQIGFIKLMDIIDWIFLIILVRKKNKKNYVYI